MTLVEDVEMQKRGVVAVVFLDGGEDNAMVLKRGIETVTSLAVRNDANHICMDGENARLKVLESTFKFSAGQFSRARLRCHYGTFIQLIPT